MGDDKMKVLITIGLAAVLCLGLLSGVQGIAVVENSSFEDIAVDQSLDELNYIALQDGIPVFERSLSGEQYEIPCHAPREIRTCEDPHFEYVAHSPYYTVFFNKDTVRMSVHGQWVEFTLPEQDLVKSMNITALAENNLFSVFNVFESVDLSYTVEDSLLKGIFVLKEKKDINRIQLGISWEGLTHRLQEDGSVLFLGEDRNEVLEILPPFMEDAEGDICRDVHYELIETKEGHELHKVIDEKGIEWLKNAVYPVVIDPSMQTFEDAWESSGLTPFGQYFKNVNEYVNPANGHLTVTQTDLVIPGRGLDVVISRIYETPAVFYGVEPYEYEVPPVNIGKGWKLDFPYIGDEYVHVPGGSLYKIEWDGNTFENHEGTHFVLVKNDNTYTLTFANGAVYYFSSAGNITHIKDVDLNTITFTYTNGNLTSITDTIGRTITFTYSGDYLRKIIYNAAELEYHYTHGRLDWMEDFLDRRTIYEYYNAYEETYPGSGLYVATGYTDWLLSKIVYVTTGSTEYDYTTFSEDDYHKYCVTDQRVYEVNQVRHTVYGYTGSFSQITSSTMTIKNESDITKGSYQFNINTSTGLIYKKVIKNASGDTIRKYMYMHNSRKEMVQEDVYNDGSTLSYSTYYAYDNWGNIIYVKNAEGHEQFFSYANTDTAGFFIDNTGTVIKVFTNAFPTSPVPDAVHTALLGMAEKQDGIYVRETYMTYDPEAHPVQSDNCFGNYTTYLTFSGTFNEKTGDTSFPIDVTGHTVTGNAVLQVTGLPSTDTYQEIHSYGCPCNPTIKCTWLSGNWSGKYYSVHWSYCAPGFPPDCDDGWASVGPFTHYPGTLGYQSYTTTPSIGGQSHTFTVTTNWKAYPAHVQYNLDNSSWEIVSSNLKNQSVKTPFNITNGSNTLYFSETSSNQTRFSWNLYVPVDNTPDTYTTTMQYDTFGNITSITDAESNTLSLTYSSVYSSAYMTEISAYTGTDTIITKATYDYYRGWMTSLQEPKGVDAGSGYDYLYTYDVLGRIIKKEFPLLPGQSQISYVEAVYDDTTKTVTIIDTLRHYVTKHYDNLGRLTDTKWYTGTYGSGTLYATESYTYLYNDLVSMTTDPGNDHNTYTYDFLGRTTQVQYPGAVLLSFSYDDTNNKITITNARNYDKIHWYDWLSRLTKIEEEYTVNSYAVTTCQYDEVGHLTSVTDAENHTTMYMYASLFGLTKTIHPDSTCEEYGYDNVGNITTVTDCNANNTTFTYDSIYRLTNIQYQDQSTVSFLYDLNSNKTKMEDNAPDTGDYVGYTYDNWNRLMTETRHISQDMYTVSYGYDAASRLTILTYPDDMQVGYSYDNLNRMTEIKRYVDGIHNEILMDNIQYDTESMISHFDYGNDLQATFSYDTRDRISTIDVKDGLISFLDLDYTYDNNSNITQLVNGWRDTGTDWHSETESYTYDGLDRLTSAYCTSWSHTYAYDKTGNRLSKDSVTYTVNTVNEVTALSDGTTFTYDSNGNRTQKTTGTDTLDYTYDNADRLVKVEENSTTIGEYIYDGKGRRLQSTENGETTTCIYSGFSVLYEETSIGTAAYIYGPFGRLAKKTTISGESNTFFYHIDHLGSTRLVTDASKNIVASITYHPFGEPCTEEGSTRYVFNGKKEDTNDLYYYGARYYDPHLGRFTTRDTQRGGVKNPQSLNRFTYCYNNPVCYLDPDGRTPKKHTIDGPAAPNQETVPVPSYDGENAVTIFTLIWGGTNTFLFLILIGSNPTGALVVGALALICFTGNWLIDLANDELFLDPMYEVQYGCYLPIYGNEPEWCKFVVHQDVYSQKYLVTIYDSQGEIVGVWTRDQYGQIISGWTMAGGKYVIYNSETGEWEDAPEGWEPGNPLPE
jgi:RHS repeat-associated protein